MSYHLFDSPRMAILVGLVLEIIIFLAWAFTSGRVKKAYLIAGPIVILVFLLLDALVETNREQLERLTEEIVLAAQNEDAHEIAGQMHEGFLLHNGLDKDGTIREIEKKLSKPLITKNNISNVRIAKAGNRVGTVEFTVTTIFDSKSVYAIIPVVTTAWRFDYIRDSDKPYKLSNMTMLWIIPGILGQRQKPIDVFTYRKP